MTTKERSWEELSIQPHGEGWGVVAHLGGGEVRTLGDYPTKGEAIVALGREYAAESARLNAPTGDCPRCGRAIPNDEEPGAYPGATSRFDNQTEVCSACGQDEAMRGFAGIPLTGPMDWPLNQAEGWYALSYTAPWEGDNVAIHGVDDAGRVTLNAERAKRKGTGRLAAVATQAEKDRSRRELETLGRVRRAVELWRSGSVGSAESMESIDEAVRLPE